MVTVFKDSDPLLTDLHRLLALNGTSGGDADRIVKAIATTKKVAGVRNLLHARTRKRAWVAMIDGYVYHLRNGTGVFLTETTDEPYALKRARMQRFDGGGGRRYKYGLYGAKTEAYKYGPFGGRTLLFPDGTHVAAGTLLTDGPQYPGDVLHILGWRPAIEFAAGRLMELTGLTQEDAEQVVTPLFKVCFIVENHDLPGRFPVGTVLSVDRFAAHNMELADKSYASAGHRLFSSITDVLAIADNDGVHPSKTQKA
jgi:hypothetical protein